MCAPQEFLQLPIKCSYPIENTISSNQKYIVHITSLSLLGRSVLLTVSKTLKLWQGDGVRVSRQGGPTREGAEQPVV